MNELQTTIGTVKIPSLARVAVIEVEHTQRTSSASHRPISLSPSHVRDLLVIDFVAKPWVCLVIKWTQSERSGLQRKFFYELLGYIRTSDLMYQLSKNRQDTAGQPSPMEIDSGDEKVARGPQWQTLLWRNRFKKDAPHGLYTGPPVAISTGDLYLRRDSEAVALGSSLNCSLGVMQAAVECRLRIFHAISSVRAVVEGPTWVEHCDELVACLSNVQRQVLFFETSVGFQLDLVGFHAFLKMSTVAGRSKTTMDDAALLVSRWAALEADLLWLRTQTCWAGCLPFQWLQCMEKREHRQLRYIREQLPDWTLVRPEQIADRDFRKRLQEFQPAEPFFFVVPFEQALHLMKWRGCSLHRGNAYVPVQLITGLIAREFSRSLLELARTSATVANGDGCLEDERFRSLLRTWQTGLSQICGLAEGDLSLQANAGSSQSRNQQQHLLYPAHEYANPAGFLKSTQDRRVPACIRELMNGPPNNSPRWKTLGKDALAPNHIGRWTVSSFAKAIGVKFPVIEQHFTPRFNRKYGSSDSSQSKSALEDMKWSWKPTEKKRVGGPSCLHLMGKGLCPILDELRAANPGTTAHQVMSTCRSRSLNAQAQKRVDQDKSGWIPKSPIDIVKVEFNAI